MTGSDHYAIAERLLSEAASLDVGDPSHAQVVAAAQVHATLALVGAQLEVSATPGSSWLDPGWKNSGAYRQS